MEEKKNNNNSHQYFEEDELKTALLQVKNSLYLYTYTF